MSEQVTEELSKVFPTKETLEEVRRRENKAEYEREIAKRAEQKRVESSYYDGNGMKLIAQEHRRAYESWLKLHPECAPKPEVIPEGLDILLTAGLRIEIIPIPIPPSFGGVCQISFAAVRYANVADAFQNLLKLVDCYVHENEAYVVLGEGKVDQSADPDGVMRQHVLPRPYYSKTAATLLTKQRRGEQRKREFADKGPGALFELQQQMEKLAGGVK
ncbi:MAG TPA: hypothetical protein VGX70_08155 [Gemmataceae bacterium]|nr:hypothetical protein [Gemmataceae bacterium]